MTEPVVSTCIAPNCERLIDGDSALCSYHRELLQRVEDDMLRDARRKIRAELRQFERLLYIEPPLHSADIAFRMPMPIKEVRKLLKKFKDDRA